MDEKTMIHLVSLFIVAVAMVLAFLLVKHDDEI